jgi:translation initiation factor 5A
MTEGNVKIAGVISLKRGNYVIIDGAACIVSDTQTSRPGKHGHSKVRVVAVGIIDGKKRDTVMPGHDNVEVPIIEKKGAQVLGIAEKIANVMDMETYETFDLAIPDELRDQVVPGVNIVYWTILKDKVMKQIKSE